MNADRLAWRFLRRDWRAGELRILLGALVIAVATTSAIGFFTDRLQRAMVRQSAELLGADLVLKTPRPAQQAWLDEARARGLRVAQGLEFPSVVLHGEALQLCDVRAVEPGYPLRGRLRIAPAPDAPAQETRELPARGEAWVEARLLPLLQASLGDTLTLGRLSLRMTRVLAFEPGSGGNLAALAPGVLVRAEDLAQAGVIAPGSRVTYDTQFAGDPEPLARYKRWLAAHAGTGAQLVDVHEGRPAIGSALDRTERYLGLASVSAALLAGVAIAMGARRYSERHFDVSAMLRCLGVTQRNLVRFYLRQLLLLGLLGSGTGVLLGFAAHWGLLFLLSGLLPAQLPPPGLQPAAFGFFTGLVLLTGFALPPVLRLQRVPPLRVLRRELDPLPLGAWLVYGAALATLALLLWRTTGSLALTASVLGGSVAALAGFGTLAWSLLRAIRWPMKGAGVAWRYGLHALWRRPALAVGQILAFGLVFMAMALTALLRGDLLSTWRSQLPARAPNHFVINVLPDQVGPFSVFLREQHIDSAALYPMVRARLTAINGTPAGARNGHTHDESLRRELNLTWSRTLQADNGLTAGRWWQPGDEGQPLVSLEAGVADRLGVGLNDRLTFDFGGGQTLEVRVASLRTVQWDSFKPNFFMIFPPGTIDRFPATYVTSFYLPPGEQALMAQMVRRFPAVTVIDLEPLMAQVRQILSQVTLAVEYVLAGVLLAGFAVLAASLQASQDERLFEGALLRTLGASRYQLRAGHLSEFVLLGGLSGLFAAAGAQGVSALLYDRVFHLPVHVQWPLWLLLPPLGALVVGAAGYWGTRRVVEQSPLAVLRGL
ncbi:MAG: FtsX-like permease family protein [Betaproteobacteria bacterium]|nr:FtsX-like permease family protein [Betaproteobacteria bacterium]